MFPETVTDPAQDIQVLRCRGSRVGVPDFDEDAGVVAS